MKKVMKRIISLLCIVVMLGVMIPAEILPVVAQDNEVTNGLKQVLTSCDTVDETSNIDEKVPGTSYTTLGKPYSMNAAYIQEGKASLTTTIVLDKSKNSTLYNIFLHEARDVRGYKYFSCQLYLPQDAFNNLKAGDGVAALGIALSPEIGDSNKNALHFYLAKSELKEGWNEIKLPFAQAEVIRNGNTDYGTYNGAAIRYIRIFQFGGFENISITTYLDDVCVLNENQGLLIGDCDQKKAPGATLLTGTLDNEYDRYNVDNAYATVMNHASSTIATDNVKEGTGALKASCFYHASSTTYRMQTSVTLSDAATLNLSKYVNKDVLHMWLYIGNWSYLQGNPTIELTSYGDAVDNGVKWTIDKEDLQTGWNEIVKPLSSGTQYTTNAIDWNNVNYIRVYTTKGATAETYTKADAYMLLDDIRIAEKEVFAQAKERDTFPKETVPSMDGYVFGGYYNRYNSETKEFSSPLVTEREATPTLPVYIRWVPEEVMTVKAQVRQEESNDCKKVLTSCDSLNGDSNIAYTVPKPSNPEETFTCSGTVSKARVKEGEASLYKQTTINTRNSEGNIQTATLYNIFLEEAVDVRGYKYFSCQLYLSNLDDLKSSGSALGIVLNSVYGESSTNALRFYLDKAELQVGWNELKLPFAQADMIANSSDANRYNGAAINYIRILQYGDANGREGTLITYLDDICVLNNHSGVLLADCDQMNAPSSTGVNGNNDYTYVNGEIKTAYVEGVETENVNTSSLVTDNVKEGTGEIKAQCFKNVSNTNAITYRMLTQIVLSDANKLDISSYKDTGSLHLWLYISDIAGLEDGGEFTIELTSIGKPDDYEANWTIPKGELTTGWNEIVLPLNTFSKHSETSKEIDWTAVNFIRVFTVNATEDAYKAGKYILVDDVRIVDSIQVATCDTTDELAAELTGTQVVKSDDVIQGGGAFVNEANEGKVQHQFRLEQPVNFEAFLNTRGCLHFWYYIEDPAYLGNDNLVVELSSLTENWDSHDKEYIIKRERLVAGWNEIYLYLGDNTDVSTGDMDWASIQHIRIFCSTAFKQACTTKIDDISLVAGNKETVDVRFISTVESLGYSKVGFEITQSRSSTPLVTETTNVYEALYAIGEDGVQDSVTPEEVSETDDSTYMHAATVVNIPNRLWDATFTIVPYWVTLDGTTVRGASKQYTINYMCSAGPKFVGLDYDTGIELDDYNRDMYGMNAFSDDSDIKGSDPGVFYISKEEDAVYGGWYYMYLSGNRGTDGLTGYTGLEDVKVKVMRSKDLYNWQDCGAIDGYSLLLYEEDWVDTTCSAFWAAEVIRNPQDGKYYMYFTAIAKIGHITGVSTTGTNDTSLEDYMDRMFLGVAESDSPIGPFVTINDTDATNGNKIPTMNFQNQYDTPEFIRALDASPFFDENGDFYLYFVRHRGQYNDGNRICGVKMDDMAHATDGTFSYLTQPNYTTVNYVKGQPSQWAEEALNEANSHILEWITSGKEAWIEEKVSEKFTSGLTKSDMQDVSINEGPSMVKRDGRYYMTYSEDRYQSKNYSVHVAVSSDPLEGFTKLSSAEGGQVCYGGLDEDMYGTGHHSLVQNADTEEWWIVYHRHAINGTYDVDANGKEVYDKSYGRYISADRVQWVANTLGYEVPSANGPLKGLNWLPESVSGYANLATTATIATSGTSGEEYLNDEILPYYSSVAHMACTSDGDDLQVTMSWDAPITISSLMIYNAHDVNAAFSKISDITFKLAKKPDWTTRAYEYARMTDIVFPERYWNAETGAYVNCAPIVANFDEITVTEITLTIRAEDHLLAQNEDGTANTSFNISEIIVLGKASNK